MGKAKDNSFCTKAPQERHVAKWGTETHIRDHGDSTQWTVECKYCGDTFQVRVRSATFMDDRTPAEREAVKGKRRDPSTTG